MQLLTSIINNNPVIIVRIIIHSVLLTSRQKRAFAIIDLPYDRANITCDTNIEPAAVNTLGLMAFRSSRYSTPVGGLQIGCRVTPYGVNANFILKEARAVNALKGIGRGSIVLFASHEYVSRYTIVPHAST